MRNGWVAPDPKMMGGIATWIGIGGGAAGNSMPAQQNNMTSQGTICKLVARYANQGVPMDQAIARTAEEIEGYKRA